MFTRCPHCQAIHALDAGLISQAYGRVVCGRCDNGFSILPRLFDHYPDHDQHEAPAARRGTPPVLGASVKEEEAELAVAVPEPVPETSRKLLWRSAAVALLLVFAANALWTFRSSWISKPAVQEFLAENELPGARQAVEFSDPAQIHLLSRDIHPHPSRAGFLVLSATFVNLADQAQPYPQVMVQLMDEGNHAVASRIFSPSEYLALKNDDLPSLLPGTHVPILLEFADPGEDAIGFEVEFY